MGLYLMGAADAYIPEPQPMRGDIEVTALYYPGTEHMPEWDMVKQVTPEVKPLLGWYNHRQSPCRRLREDGRHGEGCARWGLARVCDRPRQGPRLEGLRERALVRGGERARCERRN